MFTHTKVSSNSAVATSFATSCNTGADTYGVNACSNAAAYCACSPHTTVNAHRFGACYSGAAPQSVSPQPKPLICVNT
jgi:hypothetical protein